MKDMFRVFAECFVFVALTVTFNAPVMAQAKVDEQVMVPKVDGVACRVSPNGQHIACMAPKGSRTTTYYDGTEGPRFDAILSTMGFMYELTSPTQATVIDNDSGPFVFSADGQHYAYAAKDGDNYVVILDGKEVDRGPFIQGIFNQTPLTFSPYGTHLYYDAVNAQGQHAFYIDGKPGPFFKYTPQEITYSPDGNHVVYVGTPDDNSKFNYINNVQEPYFGDRFQFTDTGHLLSVFHSTSDATDILVADGKKMMKAAQINNKAWISPHGTYVASLIVPAAGQPTLLTLNTKPVPGTQGMMILGVYFSPDGKHYAVLCQTPNQTMYMITDGKKELEYTAINPGEANIGYSPDSSKFFYAPRSGQQTFMVINGEESDGFGGIGTKPVFSADGKHMAYGTWPSSGVFQTTFFVDDKQLPVHPAVAKDTFGFSPDGSHYAFTFGNPSTLVFDDKDIPNIALSSWMIYQAEGLTTSYLYLFSPDSQHIAYFGSDKSDPNQHGVWLDQKLVFNLPATVTATDHLNFTPDGQHLIWEGAEQHDDALPTPYQHHRVFVDGKPSAEFPMSVFDNHANSWTMGPDGTLTIYAQTSDSIKRYRITPGGDANVSSLLAAGIAAK